MTAETGSAGRRRNGGTCFDEYLKKSLLHSLEIDLLCCGDNDTTNVFGNLLALHNFCGGLKILKATVGAGADNDLIYLDIARFTC